MIVQRLIFKLTKFFKILLMSIRFNKICMGSVFLGHPVAKFISQGLRQFLSFKFLEFKTFWESWVILFELKSTIFF